MEVKSDVLVNLTCSMCKGYLSVGPVLLLMDGKSVCGRCSIPDEQQAIRMLPYEHLAEGMLFPCQYQWRGCTVKQTFATLKVHEANCNNKQYSCPLRAGNCQWNGPKIQLLQHCTDIHPEQVLENPTEFQYDITKASVNLYLIAAFNMLFLIHTEVSLVAEKIYHCVRLLADSGHTKDYDYSVEISNETNNIIKKGCVAPQECLTQIENDSLAVNINSIIEILGGIKGMTFKLTINSLIKESVQPNTANNLTAVQPNAPINLNAVQPNTAIHLNAVQPNTSIDLNAVQPNTAINLNAVQPNLVFHLNAVQPNLAFNLNPHIENHVDRLFCDDCSKNITYKLAYFMPGQHWLCSNCVNNSEKCDFHKSGCNFRESAHKASIHSQYYCRYRKKCDICESKFRGSLENHYQNAHSNITHTAGLLWNEKIARNEWKSVIINSDVGRLHCSHRLHYSQFKFDVDSSIPDGKLHFYTCTLEFKNTRTGETALEIMSLNEEYDWRIKMPEAAFMQFVNNNTFGITLTINKTK